jgi:hypothetical protein
VPLGLEFILVVCHCSRQLSEFNIDIEQFRQHVKIISQPEVTPYSKVLLEKLIASQLVNKYPEFYETQRFISVFTKACHWSLY